MGNSGRKVPEIALLYVGNKALAVRIDAGDPRGAIQHVRPLRCRMPMQFPDAAGGESHVYAREGLRDCQLAHGHLARPPSLVQPLVCEREGILESLYAALVRR